MVLRGALLTSFFLSIFFSQSSFATDYSYLGLDRDYLYSSGNRLGEIPAGQYGCREVVAKSAKRQAGELGAILNHYCGGRGKATWVPGAEDEDGPYWMVCCQQAGLRPHNRALAR